MITFDTSKKQYKVYLFDNINDEYTLYKTKFELIPTKELIDEAENTAKKLILNLIKESPSVKKDKNYDFLNDHVLLEDVRTKFSQYNCNFDFINSIFKSEKLVQAENAKGNVEIISEEQFKNYIDLAILREDYLTNPNKNYDLLNIMPIFRCLENFHTHSSKYIDSSSKLTLNNYSNKHSNTYLNSSTIDLGIPITFLSTGGFGRDNSGIMKAISALFKIENKIYSVYSILLSLVEKKSKNIEFDEFDEFEHYIINKLSFESKLLPVMLSLSEKLNCNNLILNQEEQCVSEKIKNEHPFKEDKKSFSSKELNKTAQVLWYDEKNEYDNKFINLVPVPSIKVLSILPILKEKIVQKYRENLLNKNAEVTVENSKESQKRIEEINKKFPPYAFRRVKSVASNPQNVSEFLFLNYGFIERFYSYKNITVEKSRTERNFYMFHNTFFNNKIKDTDLSSNLNKYLDSSSVININLLPNSVANRLYKGYFAEIANKIAKPLKEHKAKIANLSKEKREELENYINKEIKPLLFQKYLVDKITQDEKKELVKELKFKYENINSLNAEQQKEVEENLENLI